MKQKGAMVGACILAAGLLFAAEAAVRRSTAFSSQSSPAQPEPGNRGMMGGGMMGQVPREAQTKMERLVTELLENQAAMEKTKSRAALKPLLGKNRVMLELLRDELSRPWGMRGEMMHGGMRGSSGGRTGRAAPAAPRLGSVAEKGRRIFAAQGCGNCHGEGGIGSPAAPSLVGIGNRMSAARIAGLIRHPGTTRMPSYPLPSSQMNALVAYVESLK